MTDEPKNMDAYGEPSEYETLQQELAILDKYEVSLNESGDMTADVAEGIREAREELKEELAKIKHT